MEQRGRGRLICSQDRLYYEYSLLLANHHTCGQLKELTVMPSIEVNAAFTMRAKTRTTSYNSFCCFLLIGWPVSGEILMLMSPRKSKTTKNIAKQLFEKKRKLHSKTTAIFNIILFVEGVYNNSRDPYSRKHGLSIETSPLSIEHLCSFIRAHVQDLIFSSQIAVYAYFHLM